MSSIIFFEKDFNICENSFWINKLQEKTNRNIIVATDGLVSSLFRDTSLIFMSQREGFSCAKNNICITTDISLINIIEESFAKAKIFYANILNFLYSKDKNKFHIFVEKIKMYKDMVDIYFPTESYSKLLQIESENIIYPWNYEQWENLFSKKELANG